MSTHEKVTIHVNHIKVAFEHHDQTGRSIKERAADSTHAGR